MWKFRRGIGLDCVASRCVGFACLLQNEWMRKKGRLHCRKDKRKNYLGLAMNDNKSIHFSSSQCIHQRLIQWKQSLDKCAVVSLASICTVLPQFFASPAIWQLSNSHFRVSWYGGWCNLPVRVFTKICIFTIIQPWLIGCLWLWRNQFNGKMKSYCIVVYHTIAISFFSMLLFLAM